MEPKPPDIAAVIPALNERENLELLLPSLWAVTLSSMADPLTARDGRLNNSGRASSRSWNPDMAAR